MKNKFYLPLFIILTFVGTVFSSFNIVTIKGEGDWVKFTDKKKAKFEVLLPESPRKDKGKTSWFISATLDEPLTNFYVSVTFYAQDFTDESFREKSKTYMDALAKVYNEKEHAPNEIQFNGLCLEYNYSNMGMKSLKRIFYKGSIMYELTVNPIASDIPKEQTEKFFSSFKFLP